MSLVCVGRVCLCPDGQASRLFPRRDHQRRPGRGFRTRFRATATAVLSLALLLVSLAAVVLLAKALSYPVDAGDRRGRAAEGLRRRRDRRDRAACPEGLAAVKSALLNRLQNSINLALGSAIASIGLTIPTVAIVSLAVRTSRSRSAFSPTDMTLLDPDALRQRADARHRPHRPCCRAPSIS